SVFCTAAVSQSVSTCDQYYCSSTHTLVCALLTRVHTYRLVFALEAGWRRKKVPGRSVHCCVETYTKLRLQRSTLYMRMPLPYPRPSWKIYRSQNQNKLVVGSRPKLD
ncbi:unnamed protein product, partial [Ectocarpus sp. 12 AP-2014]